MRFVHDALPMRVVFGPGRLAELGEEVERLGLTRVLVLGTPEQEATLQRGRGRARRARCGRLRGRAPARAGRGGRARPPTVPAELGADGCVVVGGGSSVGLGKAVALRHGLPVVAVPTTYAGSEMTPIWGLTEDGVKRTGRDRAVLPRSVVYDPELTVSLPVGLSVTSGLNAVAHAVEGAVGAGRYADHRGDGRGGRAGTAGGATDDRRDPRATWARGPGRCRARGSAVRCSGRRRCRCTTSSATSWAARSTCRTPRPTPWCSRTSWPTTAPPRRWRSPRWAGRSGWAADPDTVAKTLADRARDLGAPTSLAALGMPADGLLRVVEQVLAAPYANPAPVTRESLTALLEAAF